MEDSAKKCMKKCLEDAIELLGYDGSQRGASDIAVAIIAERLHRSRYK